MGKAWAQWTAPRLLLTGLPEPRQGTDDKTAPSVSTYWLPDAVQRCDCGHSYTANNPLGYILIPVSQMRKQEHTTLSNLSKVSQEVPG